MTSDTLRQGPGPCRLAMRRRGFLTGIAATASTATMAPMSILAAEDAVFGLQNVVDEATALAGKDYAPSQQTLRAPFADIDYDHYRAIRFREDRRLWLNQGRGFTADMRAPGFLFDTNVAVAEVNGTTVRPIPFDATAFDFDPSHFDTGNDPPTPDASEGHGWTGLRLQYPLNGHARPDEVAVFQGASYFRAVARGLTYGLSARGLAIVTGSGQPEEFPAFTRFWLRTPASGATEMTVFALLDSPSIVGAYAFTIRPGRETVMDVECVLVPRREVDDVGIAPLTSMFWFSALGRHKADDYRGAVHDSDGLLMLSGRDERLWRTLTNPATLQVSAFGDTGPRGFGLVQRQRAFAAYNDTEARYDLRPSAWIEPRGDWGAGSVVLVEIPTQNEFHDNIVAFWRPDAPLRASRAQRFDYRLTWAAQPPDDSARAQVIATRSGRSVNTPDGRTFMIDFDLFGSKTDDLTVDATATAGVIDHARRIDLPDTGTTRVALQFTPPADGVAELRLRLIDGSGAAASETWLHRWTPA